MNMWSTVGIQGGEATQHGTGLAYTSHYTRVESQRMCNAKSEP